MCEVIDKAMNEGRLEGRTEGRTEGMIEGKIVGAVITLNEEGYTVEEIAKRKNISKEEVERILKDLIAFQVFFNSKSDIRWLDSY